SHRARSRRGSGDRRARGLAGQVPQARRAVRRRRAVDRGAADDGSPHARDATGVCRRDGQDAGADAAMNEPLIRAAAQRDSEALARLIGQLEYAVTAEAVAERLAIMQAEG